jgi:hypothetical protein
VAVAQARYTTSERQRKLLAWLLGRVRDQEADRVVLDLLAGADGEEAVWLVRAAIDRRVVVPADVLVRLLADAAVRGAAIDAAGLATTESAKQTLVPLLRRYLDNPVVRNRAALALGRMKATSCTGDIVARLPQLQGLEHDAFVVALELMGDPAAIGGLRDWLTRAPANAVWSLNHALGRLGGWEPLTPPHSDDNDAWAAAVRRAWVDRDPAAPPRPRVEDVELIDTARARLVVRDGQARIGVDYNPPLPGSSWPRWDKSLRIADQPVYAVGSDCGTCETTLGLLGWPINPAATVAQRLRHHLANVGELTTDLIDAAAPLLAGLRTGHYLAVLVDLDLEHVTDPTRSWWWRRLDRRGDDDGSHVGETPAMHWPGTDHLQLRVPIPARSPPTESCCPPTRSRSPRPIPSPRTPTPSLMAADRPQYY